MAGFHLESSTASDVTSTSDLQVLRAFKNFTTVVLVLESAVGIAIIISNTLTLYAIHKSKGLLGKKGMIYILSLTLADLLLGLSFVLRRTLCLSGLTCHTLDEFNKSASAENMRISFVFIGIFYNLSLGASMFTLFTMAVDRLLAISQPIFYKNQVTIFRIRLLLALIWVYIFVSQVSVFAGFAWQVPQSEVIFIYNSMDLLPRWIVRYVMNGHAYVSLFGNLILYTFISILLQKRQQQFQPNNSGNDESTKTKQSYRFTKTAIVTVAVMFLLWTPHLVLENVYSRTDPDTPALVRYYLLPVFNIILFSSAWVNPVIYCWLNRDYRKAYMNIFPTCCHKNAVKPGDSRTSTVVTNE